MRRRAETESRVAAELAKKETLAGEKDHSQNEEDVASATAQPFGLLDILEHHAFDFPN